jgi:regulator of sigma E protease
MMAFGWPEVLELLKGAWYLLLVLIGFSVIIFVHELGHFLTAKWVGIRIETFAIGFGPRLFGFKRGETDYCIRALPLGGYVKMMGQEDFAMDQDRVEATKIDPGSFLAKTPGQRALVVSGGVVMNVIFAAIAFVVIFMHGWQAPAPVAGNVLAGSPAAEAGIKSGDRFVSVNGEKVLKFNELQMAIALSNPKESMAIVIDRDGKRIETKVQPLWSKSSELQQIGISGAGSLIVRDSGMDIPGKENLKPGDQIVKVDSITPKYFNDIEQAIYKAQGKPVELTVERTVDGKITKTVKVIKRAHLVLLAEPENFRVEAETGKKVMTDTLSVLGLMPRRIFLFTPEKGGAASNVIDPSYVQAGDVIVQVGKIKNPTGQEIRDFLAEKRGEEVDIQILREDAGVKTAKLYVPLREFYFDMLIGQLGFDDMNAVVADVVKDSAADMLKLPRGAKILTCNEQPIENWFGLLNCLEANAGKDVKIGFELNGKTRIGTMAIPKDAGWQSKMTYAVDFVTDPVNTTIKGEYPHQAFMLGMRETWMFIKSAYVMLQRLTIDRTIGAKQLSGPLFIIHKGREVAEAGFYMLLYYLALISANLAVINFLPIPVVDGGLMIILLLEKIRGRPMSGKATAIWQGVGLTLIIALFVFVTWNDVSRMIRGG